MNETRLIDANALIREVNENRELYERERLYLEGLLLNAPTVEERPHGEWLKSDIPESVLSKCSLCGFDYGAYTHNFCPNCGADMRPENKVRIPSCLTNPKRQAELLERYKEE